MTLVLLHGFLGLPESWSEVMLGLRSAERVVRPALHGHGPADWSLGGSFDDEIARLATSLREQHLVSAHVVGYSMGARLALVLAARHPELVGQLTLVGGTAGIDDDDERSARAAADLRLADVLRAGGLPAFVRNWEALPLFATQERLSADVRARHRARRLSHHAPFVAHALETLSPGRMPVMTRHLRDLDVPVTLVAGSLDPKFASIARAIAPLFPRARVEIVDGAGHDVCLERPRALAALLSAHPDDPSTLTEIAP
jgi:2-succinyl-6-hydroxy-2,4-cyclohexadiene-1-carboxylate synthase